MAHFIDNQAKTRHNVAKRLGDQMKYQLENFDGHYDFRCNYHEGWVMESHLHEYSELLYCKEGVCRVNVDGKSIILPEKHLIWLPPNCVHQYLITDAQLICAVFSKDYIPLFFQTVGDRKLKPIPIAAGELTDILERFHTIKKEGPLVISGYLNLIAAKVLGHSEFEASDRSDGVLYQKVISFISAHFRENITIKHIAKEFGYNEKYLSHTLHELTGIHFSKLIALYRVDYAKMLLMDKNISISQIAEQSGFSAINSFNRVFKEFTGTTPSEYKKHGLIK